MIILGVHDLQQDLTVKFAKTAKKLLVSPNAMREKKEIIYLKGQEMGFCNDEIEVLLDDVISSFSQN